LIKAT
jgi:hypothetical protein